MKVKERRTEMLSYKPLWKTLIDQDKKKTQLVSEGVLSWTLIRRMANGLPVSLSTVEKICRYLDCKISDVVEYIPDLEVKDPETL